ncbi:MAG: RIP metalloprotease RseP [Bacteroidia bacterium]|nr:RIP metalloprotease RseP [Bacteroidia bacterium]
MNKNYLRLAIIAGALLLGLLIGYLTHETQTVVDIYRAVGLMMLGITILVTIHELGHFLPAKWFKMRVEAFSIGFPPTVFSVKKGETEYQIGATPLGGFVKISGIIDESMDTQHVNLPPQPWEFRAKPVWQRLIVMLGGVTMNVILGILIFTGIKIAYGDVFLPVSELKYGLGVKEYYYVAPTKKIPRVHRSYSLWYMIGFRNGDIPVSFKGKSFPYVEDYSDTNLLLEENAWYEVLREGDTVRLEVPPMVLNLFSTDTIEKSPLGINTPAMISVDTGAVAYKAGLRTGDLIQQIDTVPIRYFNEISFLLRDHHVQPFRFTVARGDSVFQTTITTDTFGRIGVGQAPALFEALRFDTLRYNFPEGLREGTREAFGLLDTNIKGLGKVASGEADASKSFSGPLGMVKIFLQAFDLGGWVSFLRLTGILSMVLAFMNILPIPALDGGHVVFLLIEAVTRREPSPKVRIIAQQIGMVLILGLMLLITFNDAARMIGDFFTF